MSIPKRVKRTRVLSTKVTEKDNRYMQLMVNRYYEEGRINQAKTSTLLRLIVKRFLRRDCPEYEQKTSISYQQEISKLYSAPKGDTRFPHSHLLQETNYTPGSSTANSTSVRRRTSYADVMRQL
jgi:hypothetical protein